MNECETLLSKGLIACGREPTARLSEGGKGECWRSMRKHGNDLCSMHEGLAHFFESTIENLKGKCVNESSGGTERMEWTLLQMNGKLKYDSWVYGFCFLNEVRLKEANAIWRNPQKMWQTWSLSDLAGEPNSNGGRPPVKFKVVSEKRKCLCLGERAYYRIGVWGDEEAVTDDTWGRNKEN